MQTFYIANIIDLLKIAQTMIFELDNSASFKKIQMTGSPEKGKKISLEMNIFGRNVKNLLSSLNVPFKNWLIQVTSIKFLLKSSL